MRQSIGKQGGADSARDQIESVFSSAFIDGNGM